MTDLDTRTSRTDTNDGTIEANDGRHDFDFWMGSWQQRNRKVVNALDPDCSEWVEFTSRSTAWPTLGGLANVDTLVTDEFPNLGHFEGMTWRIFDPESGLWRIWWASITRPGVVDPPVVGRFVDGHGVFECDDVLDGVAVRVRYDWDVVDRDEAHWQQSFSFDEGQAWHVNWVTVSTRIVSSD